MTTEELVLLGFDLALGYVERKVVEAEMAKWRAAGKTDAEIGKLLMEMLDNEVTAAKADSAAKRRADR